MIRLRLRCYAVLTQHSTYFIIEKGKKTLLIRLAVKAKPEGYGVTYLI